MATRNITQLKSWFKRGLYPSESQFHDWLDSFFHKEEKIPIASIDQLTEQLNGKYPDSEGNELEKKHNALASDVETHKSESEEKFGNIYDNIEVLENEDDGLHTRIDNIRVDVTLIGNMLKNGATLAEAKEALLAIGENYKDLFAVAGTLKAFLEASDTADNTINTWKEIERFLQNITDTDSLTVLLEQLESSITSAYTTAIEQSAYTHPNDSNTRHVTDNQIQDWNNKATTNVANNKTNGLMSAADKSKLDNIKIWTGSQAEYNAINPKDPSTLYFIS